MLNIWIDSFARAGGIESGIDARLREGMPPASLVDALPEPAAEAGKPRRNTRLIQAGRALSALLHFKLSSGYRYENRY